MSYNLALSKPNFYVNVNFQGQNNELIITFSSTVSQLRKTVFEYFNINEAKYDLYYKNIKLNNEDLRPISLLFHKETKPLLFIIDKKSILSTEKPSTVATFITNLNEKKFFNIVSKFFEYKAQPFNAEIKNPATRMFQVKFRSSLLAEEFKQFYEIQRQEKVPKARVKLPRIISSNSISNISDRASSLGSKFETKSVAMNRVLHSNSKSDLTTERNLSNNNCTLPTMPRNKSKKYMHPYEGMYLFPFMNPDEKYYRDMFLDKKNWINKKGFYCSVGNYKMGRPKFIGNYVNMTPSEPPLNHKFRDVNRNKWMDQKGFYL